ncbi:MAG: DUF2142 domain-containing protein [Bacteroidetes bacterium]|nr:DUF2142 domain-containing protein [Bacteroidota bacterium]
MDQCAVRRGFLLVASLVGLLYALLVPPFQSPDETAHFYRTAHLASGHLMGIKTSDQRLGGRLPKSLSELYLPFANLRYDYGAKVSQANFRKAWQLALNPNDAIFIDFPNVGYYSPFPYFFQAGVMRFLMVFQCRPMLLLYVGRLATLAIWILLILAALRLTPLFAKPMAWLALLPSSMFLHASLTGDAVTNGLCFWLLAALMSLLFTEGKIGKKLNWRIAGIFICSAMISLSKPVYFPIVLLAWLIPKANFHSTLRFYAFAGGLCLTNLILLAWWYSYAGGLFIPYDEYNPLFREGVQLNEGVQPHEQLAFVLAHPLEFFKIAILSYWESAPATLAHYFGKFGWEKNYLPSWMIALLFIATAWVALSDSSTIGRLSLKLRIGFGASAITMMGALALVLYMQWMPVGADRVMALSGRYFIPVFPLIFLAVGGFFVSKSEQRIWFFCKMLLAISMFFGAWEVMTRYYI